MQNEKEKKHKAPGESEHNEADWAHDIENRNYYYDDSTGYEVYDPDAEDVEEEAEEEAETKAFGSVLLVTEIKHAPEWSRFCPN